MSHQGRNDMTERLFFEDFPVSHSLDFGEYVVTEDRIKGYAEVFDPLRLRGDRAPAASPWQICAILMRMNYDGWMWRAAARGAPGVDEVCWFEPICAGTLLTARATVLNARVSRTKPQLGLVRYRYELLRDGGHLVFSQTNYVIMERRSVNSSADIVAGARQIPARLATTAQQSKTQPQAIALGTTLFTRQSIRSFAAEYDPQPFHVDDRAAKSGPFGALAASGWHTASSWMAAYSRACLYDTSKLPLPAEFRRLKNLYWRRPVLIGDRITWTFAATATTTSPSGEAVVTSHNSGLDETGAVIFEFDAAMTIRARVPSALPPPANGPP